MRAQTLSPEQRALEYESLCIELEARMEAVQRENNQLREEVKRLQFTANAVHRLAEENDELQRAYQELRSTLADVHHLLDDHERLEDELEEQKIQLQIAVDTIQTKEHELTEMETNYQELLEMCEALMSEREVIEQEEPVKKVLMKSRTEVEMHVYKSRLARSKKHIHHHNAPRSKREILQDLSEGYVNAEATEEDSAGPVTRSRAHTRELSLKLEQGVKEISKILENRCSSIAEEDIEARRDGVMDTLARFKKLPGFTNSEAERLNQLVRE